MNKRSVVVVNHSRIPDSEVNLTASAVNRQIRENLLPTWGIYALVWAGPEVSSTWKIHLWDEPPVSAIDSLGKREIENGNVFIGPCQRNKTPWSVILSHETLELLVNPQLNKYVLGSGRFWAHEICDPVKGSLYSIDGVLVANFVYPEWFLVGGVGKFDHLGLLKSSFSLLPEGYASTYPVKELAEVPLYGVK
jgi:hypothetical protein